MGPVTYTPSKSCLRNTTFDHTPTTMGRATNINTQSEIVAQVYVDASTLNLPLPPFLPIAQSETFNSTIPTIPQCTKNLPCPDLQSNISLEYTVLWIQVPPEAGHEVIALGVILCCVLVE